MQCPVCADVTLAVSSREGVEIDYCPQCRGVWLDRGELDKIIDRVVSERPTAPPLEVPPPRYDEPRHEAPRYDERRYDDDRRYDRDRDWKRKKRRSFLEDIFDFD